MQLKFSRWGRMLSWLLLLLSLVFAASRTVSYGPNTGDIAVWIPVHEWLSRGYTLYSTVWDHKDWGFFWLTQPLFAVLGTSGLYLAAYLSVIAFGAGVFLLSSCVVSRHGAIALAAVALATYTASPSFLSVYTENMAIGLFVLGLGLLSRLPLIAGCLFALSASVKVAGVFVWFVVVAIALSFALTTWRRNRDAKRLHQLTLCIVGFAVIGFLILTVSYLQGSLPGWLDVIQYNRQYQAMRGFPPPVSVVEMPFAVTQGAISDLAELPLGVFAFLLSLILTGALLLFALLYVWIIHRRRPRNPISIQLLLLAFGFMCATLLVTISQRPAWHHWQYVIGSLVLCVTLLAAVLISELGNQRQLIRILVVALLVVPLTTAGLFNSGLLPREAVTTLDAWRDLEDEGQLSNSFKGMSPNQSLIVFGTNGSRLDYGALPSGTRLGCKFFYQFDHLLPRYRGKIEDCLKQNPDLVLVENSSNWADDELRIKVNSWLPVSYSACDPEDQPFTLWVRLGSACPSAQNL